jgi:pyruvate/2-oxoglutarate/acetoin dehydrogenase E1 component
MARSPHVVAYGEDFRLGYVWPVSRGLVEEFGEERVLDAPLSEQLQPDRAFAAPGVAGLRLVAVLRPLGAVWAACAGRGAEALQDSAGRRWRLVFAR